MKIKKNSVLGREISCLTAWRVPECLGWPKTSEYDQITRFYVLIKKCQGEKSLCISQGYRFKKKILNQSQKKIGLKKAYFFGSP